MGDDIAALLDYLKITRADLVGHSFGGASAIRAAIRYPDKVRRLVVSSSPYGRFGWYPQAQEGMSQVGAWTAGNMMQTPTGKFSKQWPEPQRFPQFLDKMGKMMSEDYDWSADIAKLPMPVLLVFADNDSVSQNHIAEFFALLGGGVKEPGWLNPQLSKSRLAVVPATTISLPRPRCRRLSASSWPIRSPIRRQAPAPPRRPRRRLRRRNRHREVGWFIQRVPARTRATRSSDHAQRGTRRTGPCTGRLRARGHEAGEHEGDSNSCSAPVPRSARRSQQVDRPGSRLEPRARDLRMPPRWLGFISRRRRRHRRPTECADAGRFSPRGRMRLRPVVFVLEI
jgi:hypothetical protein